MVSAKLLVPGLVVLFSTLSSVIAAVLTFAIEGGGGLGAGIGIGILLGIVGAIAASTVIGDFTREMGVAAERLAKMVTLDSNIFKDEPEVVGKPTFDEAVELQFLITELHETLSHVVMFLPQSLYRLTKDERAEDSSVNKDTRPVELQSQGTLGKMSIGSSSTNNNSQITMPFMDQYLEHRRVSILVVNLRSFRHQFSSDTMLDDVTELLNDYIKTVHGIVSAQRGTLDTISGDHLVVSYNAFVAARSHTWRAARSAISIAETVAADLPTLTVSMGISTGNAYCGNVGEDLRRPMVIGTVLTQAHILQRMTKMTFPMPTRLAGIASEIVGAEPEELGTGLLPTLATDSVSPMYQILCHHHVATDCEHDYVTQTIDVINLPGSLKPMTFSALYPLDMFEAYQHARQNAQKNSGGRTSQRKSTAHDEWMYQVDTSAQANPFFCLNSGFTALLEGSIAEAKEALEHHKELMSDSGVPRGTRMLASFGERRLKIACEAVAADTFREGTLGEFYRQCVGK